MDVSCHVAPGDALDNVADDDTDDIPIRHCDIDAASDDGFKIRASMSGRPGAGSLGDGWTGPISRLAPLSHIYSRLRRSCEWSSVPNSETELLEEGLYPDSDHGSNSTSSAPSRLSWCLKRLRDILFRPRLNILLIFLPLGLWTYLAEANPLTVFVCNAATIVPLSAILTDATERVAMHAGDTVGALLNISLGNIVELIILIALMNGKVRVVQSSILGSILVNILPILGAALCINSFSDDTPMYDTIEMQVLSCLLFVSVFVFLMPSAFETAFGQIKGFEQSTLKMCRMTALVVLVIYAVYLIHELSGQSPEDAEPYTGPDIDMTGMSDQFDLEPRLSTDTMPVMERQPVSDPRHFLLRTISFADEERPMTEGDPGDTMEAHRGREMRSWRQSHGRRSVYDMHSRNRSGSVSIPKSRASSRGGSSLASSAMNSYQRVLTTIGLPGRQRLRRERVSMESLGSAYGASASVAATAEHGPTLDVLFHVGVLFVTSGLMSIFAEFLVSSIEQVTRGGHLSETVIGLIILPVVGNLAECVTVMTVAARGKLDLAIAVAIGSAVQIALCVTPLTIIAGWILSRDMDLTFNSFEVGALVGTVTLVNLVMLSDSTAILHASRLKGVLMCACYFVIGLAAYLSP